MRSTDSPNTRYSGKIRVFQLAIGVGVIALAASAGCSLDPVHDTEVQALGGEDPNIPQSEYHRAGQPCTVCHGGEGPASTTFAVAGTIYYQPYDGVTIPQGVDTAYVRIIDDQRHEKCFATNCMGNFYATPSTFGNQGLVFPFLVSVQGPGAKTPKNMIGHVGREASCSNCHRDPTFFDSPGHIHLDLSLPATEQCPPQSLEPRPVDCDDGAGGSPPGTATTTTPAPGGT